jgi:hypothetical protein
MKHEERKKKRRRETREGRVRRKRNHKKWQKGHEMPKRGTAKKSVRRGSQKQWIHVGK